MNSFYFFKVLSIFNTKWQHPCAMWTSEKTCYVFREVLAPLDSRTKPLLGWLVTSPTLSCSQGSLR